MRQFIFMILVFLYSQTNLLGQKILDFDKLSIDDGFTASKANAIIQDSKGFIWIGTWNGLNRYDGYKCEIFRPRYHDTTAISNREVMALLEDHSGNIWIGTTSGLNCFDPRTEQLKRYPFKNRILSLLEDHNHIIWVGTWNGGLFKLDPLTGEMKNYLSSDIISDIHEDSRNILWVSTYYGLVNFDRGTSSYVRYLPDENRKNTISHSVITQIVEAEDGKLWLGSWGGGIIKVIVHPNKDSLQFIPYKVREGSGSLSSNVVYRLFYDDYGNLWAGTWNAGLNLLEHDQHELKPEEAHFYNFMSDLSDPYGISGNNISSLFVDRSGVLWVGSSKIDRTTIIKTGVTRYKTTRYTSGRYSERPVRSFAEDGNWIWVGTLDELMLYDFEKGNCEFVKDIPKITYQYKGYNYVSNSILSLLTTEHGLWAGTEDAGLILFPGKSAETASQPTFRFFNTQTNPRLPGNKVSAIKKSLKNPELYWIGTMQNGFARLTFKNDETKIHIFKVGFGDQAVSDYNIRAIVEDKSGKVWIGTQNGLNCYDPETNKFQKFFYSSTDTNSINDNVINSLYEDHNGNLWIGTNLGLNKKQSIKLKDGSEHTFFKSYPNINNLSDKIITNILEDDSNHLWIGLYRGIIKFDEINEEIVKEYFTKEYQHAVIERNSSIKTQDGYFFFGGANGFISTHPDSLLKHSLSPRVCITDLLVFNKSILPENKDVNTSSLSQAIPYAESVELSYKDKILTFVFSAMDYKDPQKNQYAYFLEGFDNEWNEVGIRNSATYTNIRPGEYIFKVKAANSDGIWENKPATLKITIFPPWWKTTLAYIIYGLFFVGLLYFFNQYSIIGVREKGRILIEHMQYEKEHELNELKSLFFTNITHEFRTPLTLILGPAEELLKENENSGFVKKQAELIQKNAQRLLRLVNQLMEFRKVEKGKMDIYIQRCNISSLLNEIYDSYKGMADSKNIVLSLILKTQQIIAQVDCEKFEKVIYNLVSNAFKYSEEGGKISIKAGIEDYGEKSEKLIVEVEDTGIGIAQEHSERVFERFFQAHPKHTQSTGGIGLYLSKAFIELHGGEIQLESELGKGSCFRIIIPLNQQHIVQDYEENPAVSKITAPQAENVIIPNPQGEDRTLPYTESHSGKSARVLIVEDDSELNDFIVSGLAPDFDVIGTFNGREGLDAARKFYPDIIITDIMMPEIDGIELCNLIRKDLITSHIPVIFLTAKTMRDDEILGLKIGAIDYIYKPFNMVTLKLKIQNILENRKTIHEKIRADQLMEPEYIELSSLDEKFLKDAVNAVNDYLDDPTFDVEKFSDVIGISANQAYRKIKALTGQTAKEFIRNQRLKTASSLFLQKKRSISEIIYMVGFSSPSYFTRCFREYYGCTPKEYIENNGEMPPNSKTNHQTI